jgi:hypothetical protein
MSSSLWKNYERCSERLLEWAGLPVCGSQEKLFGFGHRVYKNFDPRATEIRKLADEVFAIAGRDPLIDVAVELERIARSDPYFVDRKLYPNVDFYSGEQRPPHEHNVIVFLTITSHGALLYRHD